VRQISLIPQFQIKSDNSTGTSRIGAERIALLEAVRDHGSISAAGRAVGMSYKAAWDGIHALNNLFPTQLIIARPGGTHGGGAELTAQGHEVIAAFHLIENEMSQVLKSMQARLSENGVPNAAQLMRSLTMRTSARNTLRGTVADIALGPVNAEICVHLSDNATIVAVITRDSVKTLDLEIGTPVTVLIKSSLIMLAPVEEIGRTSARNKLFGTVAACEEGSIYSIYTLDIGGGKTLSASITQHSADELGLNIGDKACALIKASHIILAIEE